LTEEIGEPTLEGGLWTDDGEVDAFAGRQGEDVCRTGDIHGRASSQAGHPGVAGSRKYFRDFRIAAEPPHEGVLAPTATDDENAHDP
jgi:hypothetical protein